MQNRLVDPLTADRARELLTYSPITGELWWMVRGAGRRMSCPAGGLVSNGYRTVKIDGLTYQVSRVIWLWVTGQFPNVQVDHINGIRHCNGWHNLKDVTVLENSKNQKTPRNNTHGVIGVYRMQGRWTAYIRIKNRSKHLYYGGDFFEAVCRRKSAEARLGYHRHHGR